MSSFCDQCGKTIENNEKYCTGCGKELKRDENDYYEQSSEQKENYLAIVGFILSLMGLITCGTFTLPSYIVSIVGFINRKQYINERNGLTIWSFIINGLVILIYLAMIIIPMIIVLLGLSSGEITPYEGPSM